MAGKLWLAIGTTLVMATPAFSQAKPAVDFARDIQPIIEKSCLGCHGAGSHLELTSRQGAVRQQAIVPGDPDKSSFYRSVRDGAMPPGGKLPQEQIDLIRRWIQQDAPWPTRVVLTSKTAVPAKGPSLSEVERIRERIVAGHNNGPGTKTYKVTLPNTTVSYDMVGIPAGDFLMGSEAKKDEQPVHKVTVPAFWMQAHEVTWDEYRLFMFAAQAGEIAHKDDLVDAVSRPTHPYVEMSFGMGINGFPAISMTQHAANKYAEWLSVKTGEFYRLPTEAEWEYACRGGSGKDVSPLSEAAWYAANSGGKYQKVEAKKPNGFGLFDMLGNVMEWTLDAYAPYKEGSQTDPYVRPTQPNPIAVRGGSWNDPASALTCSSRVASDASWKQQDPQLPKSIWYETDAQWLGFRLIRPAEVPSAEQMYQFWNNGVEHDEQ